LSPLHQRGADGIAFDIAQNGEEMMIFLDGKSPEASLPGKEKRRREETVY
jgi:hypothetical protein